MPKLIMSRLLRVAAVLGAASVALVMASAGTANAIANGTPVAPGQYLFSTKLTMTNIPRSDGSSYNSACSAALIAPQWVITAGHCFHDINGNRVGGTTPYPTTATVGRTDLAETGGYVLGVTQVLQAPQVDIAIAKLEAPADGVGVLPLSAVAPKAGTILRVTGWGATSSVNPVPATHLQTGQVKIKRVSGTSVFVVGYAPARDTSACLYDSGAPYFVELSGGALALVTIESDGPACPHARQETTSSIYGIRAWILQNAI